MKRRDLSGQRFGNLLVIEPADDYISKNGRHRTQWLCKCDCGQTVKALTEDLVAGNKTHCGCKGNIFRDLTNKRFGNLVVIKRTDDKILSSGRHLVNWDCLCDCGKHINVTTAHLLDGHTRSCGCATSSMIGKKNKKYNTYDLSGNFGKGYTLKGEEFWFDKEDYDKIKDYCWFYDKNGYVRTNSKPRNIFLHRLVLGIPFKEKGIDQDVDHIVRPLKGGLVFDNRKQNLRICTRSENCMNVKHKGITKTKYGKWSAQIKVNKKVIYLGVFETEELATKARRDAEQIYHKDFAYKHDAKRNLDELEELV